MLHLDQGGKNQLYTWYFGGLLKESPNLDFDVFGLSYYPMWHGTMEGLQYNLNYLATTYNKEVCVVETAYARKMVMVKEMYSLVEMKKLEDILQQ